MLYAWRWENLSITYREAHYRRMGTHSLIRYNLPQLELEIIPILIVSVHTTIQPVLVCLDSVQC